MFRGLRNLPLCRWASAFFCHYLGGLYRRSDEHHVFLLAGGIAFSLFACVIPLLLIIFAVLGRVLDHPSIAREIGAFVDRVVPYPEYAAFVKNQLLPRLEEFKIHKNLAGVVGLAGLLLTSSGLFSSMRTALNAVYGARTRRLAILGKLKDVGLVLLVLVYFLLSTIILPAAGIADDLAEKLNVLRTFRFGFFTELLMHAVSLALVYLVFWVLYLFLPQARLAGRVVLISAFWAAILWLAAEQLFGLYLKQAATLTRVYGAFTLIIVVALWVYYTALVFILGAEIGQLYRERQISSAQV